MKTGDRIEMVNMPEDPNPIPRGTQGTVTHVNPVNLGGDRFTQVSVNWDNGRTLMVVIPPDSVRVIS